MLTFFTFLVIIISFIDMSLGRLFPSLRNRTDDLLNFHKLQVPEQYSFRLVETIPSRSYHREYRQIGRAAPDSLHTVIFVMKQNNIDRLRQILFEVSDFDHPNYGRYLNGEEIRDLTMNPLSVRHLESVLSFYGLHITSRTLYDEYVTVNGPISTWERIFQTEFFEFSPNSNLLHVDQEQVRLVRTLQYSLPVSLISHVSAVFNTIHFPASKELLKTSRTTKSSLSSIKSGFVTPQLINKLYDIRSNKGSTLASQGVYEALDQSFSPSDLTFFQKFFHLPEQAVATDIGGHQSDRACLKKNGQDCAEANLDVQYLMAVAQDTPTTYYYWAGKDFMTEWLVKVAAMTHPPLVFSISYGLDELALPSSYFSAFDLQAMKLGVRGVSILAAAGDDGAVTPDARKSFSHCRYAPQFPASSPFVTAVGGTMGPEKGGKEVVCQSDRGGSITGGGGFSLAYPTPDWQRDEVQTYLSMVEGTAKEPKKGFAKQGRGYPDFSLLAHNYVVAIAGNLSAVSGTSASSPVAAGMVTLVNSARLSKGLPPLGWLNPTLYKLFRSSPSVFRDISDGINNCVASDTVCCAQGFYATTGWDPASGLGSLNFTAFKSALLSLDTSIPVTPGSPTQRPVHSPTISPSSSATSAPTSAPGWMLIREFSGLDCSGDVTALTGVPTGVCQVVYDENKSPVGSSKYFCEEGAVVGETYSDSHCSTATGVDLFGIGCAVKAVDYYYSDNFYSADLSCVSHVDIQTLIPDGPNKFAVETSFDDLVGCNDMSKTSRFDAFLTSYCFENPHKSISYKINFPSLSLFKGKGCHSSKPEIQTLDTTCKEVVSSSSYGYGGDSNYYSKEKEKEKKEEKLQYYYSYQSSSGSTELFSQWSLVHGTSSSTSKRPSPAPTSAVPTTAIPSLDPTSASPSYIYYTSSPSTHPSSASPSSELPTYDTTIVSRSSLPVIIPVITNSYGRFTVMQVLQGVTSKQILSDSVKSDMVLKRSVADLLTGILLSNVVITSVRDFLFHHHHLSSLSTTIGCAVNYSVSFNTIDTGFRSPTEAFRTYSKQLSSSVVSGEFDQLLQQYALAYDSLVLLSVSVQSVKATSLKVSSDNSDLQPIPSSSQSNNSLTVALTILFVLLLLLCLMCCYCKQQIRDKLALLPGYQQIQLDSDSVHSKVVSMVSDADVIDFNKTSTMEEEFVNNNSNSNSEIEMTTIQNPMMVSGGEYKQCNDNDNDNDDNNV